MTDRTVLVVDDEEGIREILKQALESRVPQARVITASSGDEALRILDGTRVDLVISDFKMPGITGIEFLTRARDRSPLAPRIMMTAYSDESIAVDAINRARVERFLTKPFEIGEAISAVKDILARSSAEVQRQQAFARSLDTLRRQSQAASVADGEPRGTGQPPAQ